MEKTISRAQFLRGDFSGAKRPIRPPGSVDEAIFVSRCSGCGDCISACETGALIRGRGGFPALDFSRGECIFCSACADACPKGVITSDPEVSAQWDLVAHIDGNCLAKGGVICRTCGERCEHGAIRFRLAVGGVALLQFDASACNGCGACVAPCPTGAVAVRKSAEESPS
ncbi:ferredoxin-type protein NapF [Thiohalomonas denitrificans]|uniref:Ferredoxin-type protein NapF n=1 Tax=Thiohalomonas denitrificans TaxID=415747 RepID=A0A1G5PT89_9GAMM|nr:ferredoxin-type protein NapF [Thiohalomonas denitrificans]SCZ52450.1 ferredoxin-type protein NapF [Thiohalomonas denitrificans]